jgi:hypothetical protein
MKTGREKWAIAGMIFGVAAIPLLYPWPFAIASATLGFFLSLAGLKSSRRTMAIVGLFCSSIVLSLMAVLTVQELYFMPKPPT